MSLVQITAGKFDKLSSRRSLSNNAEGSSAKKEAAYSAHYREIKSSRDGRENRIVRQLAMPLFGRNKQDQS